MKKIRLRGQLPSSAAQLVLAAICSQRMPRGSSLTRNAAGSAFRLRRSGKRGIYVSGSKPLTTQLRQPQR